MNGYNLRKYTSGVKDVKYNLFAGCNVALVERWRGVMGIM